MICTLRAPSALFWAELSPPCSPVNSLISLDDGKNELAVVTDVTMGGASMADGELEIMVHRRCQKDDSRGVQVRILELIRLPFDLKILYSD